MILHYVLQIYTLTFTYIRSIDHVWFRKNPLYSFIVRGGWLEKKCPILKLNATRENGEIKPQERKEGKEVR